MNAPGTRRRPRLRTAALIVGVVFLLLFLYGLLIGHDSAANFVPVNNADNWLHLVLGAGMIPLGTALSRRHTGDRC